MNIYVVKFIIDTCVDYRQTDVVVLAETPERAVEKAKLSLKLGYDSYIVRYTVDAFGGIQESKVIYVSKPKSC